MLVYFCESTQFCEFSFQLQGFVDFKFSVVFKVRNIGFQELSILSDWYFCFFIVAYFFVTYMVETGKISI